jgi:hypothetical protein
MHSNKGITNILSSSGSLNIGHSLKVDLWRRDGENIIIDGENFNSIVSDYKYFQVCQRNKENNCYFVRFDDVTATNMKMTDL